MYSTSSFMWYSTVTHSQVPRQGDNSSNLENTAEFMPTYPGCNLGTAGY
uniref:Uncharacterized protein n=1 Tax=Arundo donax TaxID=35708 RepID=A0A0A9H2X3_ARUDO